MARSPTSTPLEHVYLDEPEHREEGGTPAIIESIRAGLVFQLKQQVGAEAIRAREEHFIDRALAAWSEVPGLQVLGDLRARRLSIVSFVIRHGDRYLHHDYVVALLNDLFGIQSRGGCSCAGPYGHRLLGIDIETSHEFEREITHGCEGIKPGWVRVNFNYFISETVFRFILDAVELVARHGWRLLPHYRFEPATGRWRHVGGQVEAPLSLHDVRYLEGAMRYASHRHQEPESRLADYLAEAAHTPARTRRTRAPRRRARPTWPWAPTSKACDGSSCPTRPQPSSAASGPPSPRPASRPPSATSRGRARVRGRSGRPPTWSWTGRRPWLTIQACMAL